MRRWLIGAMSTCALLAACGPQPTTQADTPTAHRSPIGPQVSLDAQFVTAAAIYERYQVQAAEIALVKAQSQAVKDYAANIRATHQAALQSLTTTALAHDLQLPPAGLNEDYRAYVDRLQANDTTPFDVRYISQQTLTTMSMAGRYDAFTSTAPNSPLKQWAASHSQAVHDDIQAAHRLAATAH